MTKYKPFIRYSKRGGRGKFTFREVSMRDDGQWFERYRRSMYDYDKVSAWKPCDPCDPEALKYEKLVNVVARLPKLDKRSVLRNLLSSNSGLCLSSEADRDKLLNELCKILWVQ